MPRWERVCPGGSPYHVAYAMMHVMLPNPPLFEQTDARNGDVSSGFQSQLKTVKLFQEFI